MTKKEREEYKRLFKEGTIGVPVNGETKIAHYWAKVYDEGSEYGIDGGRISKLQIRIDGVTVVNYDRGWDIKPDENDEAAAIALAILMKDYN